MQIWFLMTLSFLLTFLLILWIIECQKRRHVGQIEREEGLRSHKKKNKTPTLGGLAFLSVTTILYTLAFWKNQLDSYLYFLLLIPFLGYGLIGLIDDLLILRKGKNDGMKPNLKFFLQIVIASLYFAIYLLFDFNTKIDFILFSIDLKFLYGIFILLAFSGFSNATNLTDGIDGLLGGTMVIVLSAFYYASNSIDVQTFLSILISALCAFLCLNLPKAKIFMGNVGALSLGGVFVSIGLILKLEIYLFVLGFVYILETASVILQVAYFKLTKGKRLFKMAPLHHHFEIIFDSETKTLILFYLLSVLSAIVFLFLIR